jgi:hypothetical protein
LTTDKDPLKDNGRLKRPAANNSYLQWLGELLILSVIFAITLGHGGEILFKIQPLQIAPRCAQCRVTMTVLRTPALLLATHSRATPKQAKEPSVGCDLKFYI